MWAKHHIYTTIIINSNFGRKHEQKKKGGGRWGGLHEQSYPSGYTYKQIRQDQ